MLSETFTELEKEYIIANREFDTAFFHFEYLPISDDVRVTFKTVLGKTLRLHEITINSYDEINQMIDLDQLEIGYITTCSVCGKPIDSTELICMCDKCMEASINELLNPRILIGGEK